MCETPNRAYQKLSALNDFWGTPPCLDGSLKCSHKEGHDLNVCPLRETPSATSCRQPQSQESSGSDL